MVQQAAVRRLCPAGGKNALWGKGGKGQHSEGNEEASLGRAGTKPGGALYSAPRLASGGASGRISLDSKNLADFLNFLNMVSISGDRSNSLAHGPDLIGPPPHINYSASPASG